MKGKEVLPYEFCNDQSTDWVGAATVDVTPYPIHIADGAHIEITANIDIIKALEAGSTIDLKLKKLGAIDIPIPCLDVSLELGRFQYSSINISHSFLY